MNCLIIKNDGIGDLVLASGLITDLVARYDAVDLITCEENRELADAIPGLRHRLYVSRDSIRFRILPARFGINWVTSRPEDRAVFGHLKTQTYDVAICLRRYIRESSLILMSKVRARTKHCAWLFPTNASPVLAEKYSRGWTHYQGPLDHNSELSYYRGFLRGSIGIDSSAPPRLSIASRASEHSLEPGLVGLSLSGNSANWPGEYWRELARLLDRHGKRLALFGGPDARPLATAILHESRHCHDYTGKLTFAQSTRELQKLELLIGNDTGFTHYACLVVLRCLVILGGGTFGRFFPWPGATNQYVIHHAMACYDCDWQCLFAKHECLHAVMPVAVAKQALSVLNDNASPRLNLCPETIHYIAGWRRSPEGCGRVEIPAERGLPGRDGGQRK